MAESTMAKFKRVEFKMAAIIKLSQNEWVKYFLCKMAEVKMAEFKMAAIIKLNENERLKFFFLAKWMNPTWQNLSWLPLLSWVRENEWSFFCANGENQSWQVWVTLRWNTKMAESNIANFKMSGFKMAAFITLSENEWVWVRLNKFESESEWNESVFEWIWEKITRCLNPRG